MLPSRGAVFPAALAFLVAGTFPALSDDIPVWRIVPEKSSVGFQSRQIGAPFAGVFRVFSADIHFDPERLDASRVVAEIETASVDTDDAERDETLRQSAWFDSAGFPLARFASTSFSREPGGSYVAEGSLTIRDVTVPVSLPFTLSFSETPDGGTIADMKGALELDRSRFGLGGEDWADDSVIPHTVGVSVTLRAERQAAVAATP